MHDSQRKELALKYIAANPHTTHQEVADKYLLEKKVTQEMKGGLKKYGYYAGDILVLYIKKFIYIKKSVYKDFDT